jgi:calmodulin
MPARKAAQVAPESSQVGSITSTPEEGNTSKTGHLDKLTEMEIYDLQTAFNMFDVDGNGARIEHTKSLSQSPTQTLYPDEQVSWSVSRVSTSEVCICVYRPGVITEKELKAVYVTFGGEEVEGNEEEIAKFMKEVDTDGSGTVDFPEFCELLIGRMQTIDDPALLEQAFKLFDKDAGGTISREELKETINDVMKGTGEAMSESEFEEMIDEFDADGDGIITFDEFKKIMQRS